MVRPLTCASYMTVSRSRAAADIGTPAEPPSVTRLSGTCPAESSELGASALSHS